jgi:hypothetical protein
LTKHLSSLHYAPYTNFAKLIEQPILTLDESFESTDLELLKNPFIENQAENFFNKHFNLASSSVNLSTQEQETGEIVGLNIPVLGLP